jgi:hypothetical protein
MSWSTRQTTLARSHCFDDVSGADVADMLGTHSPPLDEQSEDFLIGDVVYCHDGGFTSGICCGLLVARPGLRGT